MDRQSRNRHLVEHILALVELLQDSPLELSRFIEEGVPEQYALPDGPSLRAACNLIQFMDEMPGGFLSTARRRGSGLSTSTAGCCGSFSARIWRSSGS